MAGCCWLDAPVCRAPSQNNPATGCAFSRLTSVALAVTSAFPICPSALDSTAPIRRRPTSSTPSDPSAEVPTSRKLRRRRYLFLFSAKNANDVHWLPAGHLGAFFKCFLLICLLNEFLSAADSMLLLHLLVETKFYFILQFFKQQNSKLKGLNYFVKEKLYFNLKLSVVNHVIVFFFKNSFESKLAAISIFQ